MSKKIDSRNSQIQEGRINEARRQVFSPTRKAAIASLGFLTAVGVGSQIEITDKSKTEVIEVHQVTDNTVDLSPEPGSVDAFRLAQEIIDPTNPDKIQRKAGELAARELISPEEN